MGFLAINSAYATVNVVVSTYDGLVIATDSRVTNQDKEKTRIASDYAEKIVRVSYETAIAFSGSAYLMDSESNLRSLSSFIEEFKNNSSINEDTHTSPELIAIQLDSFFTSLYNKSLNNVLRGELTIIVCGVDNRGERQIFELVYPLPDKTDTTKIKIQGSFKKISDVPQSIVTGQKDVWHRLIKGYDSKLRENEWFKNVDSIIVDSLASNKIDTTTKQVILNFDDLRYDIRYDLMTLQDAIDFAIFIIRATIEAQRFNEKSIQGVGGSIDVAVITTEGFRWIQHKELHGEGYKK